MRRLVLIIGLCLIFVACREVAEKEAVEKIWEAEAALVDERWEDSANAFHEVIILDPKRPDAWVGRGMALTSLDDPCGARAHYEQAISIYDSQLHKDPENKSALRGKIMLLVLLDRADEASVLAKKAAVRHPDDDFVRQLPELVEEMKEKFSDMVLPPPSKHEVSLPFYR